MLHRRSLLSLAIALLSQWHTHSRTLAFLLHEYTFSCAPKASRRLLRFVAISDNTYSAVNFIARRILSVKRTS